MCHLTKPGELRASALLIAPLAFGLLRADRAS
jgi:hypothetical protein